MPARLVVLGIVAFALTSAAWAAWSQGWTYDEPFHLLWSRRLLESRVTERESQHRLNTKAPVMLPNVLAQRAARGVMGDDPRRLRFAARLPSVAWLAVLLATTFALGRRAAGETAALIATAGTAQRDVDAARRLDLAVVAPASGRGGHALAGPAVPRLLSHRARPLPGSRERARGQRRPAGAAPPRRDLDVLPVPVAGEDAAARPRRPPAGVREGRARPHRAHEPGRALRRRQPPADPRLLLARLSHPGGVPLRADVHPDGVDRGRGGTRVGGLDPSLGPRGRGRRSRQHRGIRGLPRQPARLYQRGGLAQAPRLPAHRRLERRLGIEPRQDRALALRPGGRGLASRPASRAARPQHDRRQRARRRLGLPAAPMAARARRPPRPPRPHVPVVPDRLPDLRALPERGTALHAEPARRGALHGPGVRGPAPGRPARLPGLGRPGAKHVLDRVREHGEGHRLRDEARQGGHIRRPLRRGARVRDRAPPRRADRLVPARSGRPRLLRGGGAEPAPAPTYVFKGMWLAHGRAASLAVREAPVVRHGPVFVE